MIKEFGPRASALCFGLMGWFGGGSAPPYNPQNPRCLKGLADPCCLKGPRRLWVLMGRFGMGSAPSTYPKTTVLPKGPSGRRRWAFDGPFWRGSHLFRLARSCSIYSTDSPALSKGGSRRLTPVRRDLFFFVIDSSRVSDEHIFLAPFGTAGITTICLLH
jgi:hypothetical protein